MSIEEYFFGIATVFAAGFKDLENIINKIGTDIQSRRMFVPYSLRKNKL